MYTQPATFGPPPADAEPYRRLAIAAVARLGSAEVPGAHLAAALAFAEGRALLRADRPAEALAFLADAEATHRRLDPSSFDLSQTLLLRSEAEMATGALADALAHARAALALEERRLGPHHPALARLCFAAARIATRTGDVDAARSLTERGDSLITGSHQPRR